VYFMRVHFRVRYDCVYGLKFVNNVWRHFLKVDKYEETMGCFAPKKEIQTIDLLPEEAPTGVFGRGTYKGKIMVKRRRRRRRILRNGEKKELFFR